MKLTCLATILLLGLYKLLPGQTDELKIKSGPTFNPNGSIARIIGKIDSVVYYFSWKNSLWLGATKSTDLSPLYEIPLENPKFKGYTVIIDDVHIFEGSLVMICKVHDPKENMLYLLAQKIDNFGNFEGKLIELASFRSRLDKYGAIDYTFFNNEKRLLVHVSAANSENKHQFFWFRLLDENLKEVWLTSFELPYLGKDFQRWSFGLDQKDRLFINSNIDEFSEVKKQKGKKEAKEQANAHGGQLIASKIFGYDYRRNTIFEIVIRLDDTKTITNSAILEDKQNILNLAGFYSKDPNTNKIDGIFYIKIDPETNEVLHKSTKDFDPQMVQDYLIATYGEKKGKQMWSAGNGLEHMIITHFVFREDGGLVISGEMQHNYLDCTANPLDGIAGCNKHYNFGTTVLMNIAPSGAIEWLKYIPKMQRTMNDHATYSSHILMASNNHIYLVFNDNPKNHEARKKPGVTHPMTATTNTGTTVAKVNMAGELIMWQDPTLMAQKTLLRTQLGHRVREENMLYLMAKTGSKEGIVEIKIEK